MDDVIEKLQAMCACMVECVQKEQWEQAQISIERQKELVERYRLFLESKAALEKHIKD